MLLKVTMPSTKCYIYSEQSSDSIKEDDKAAADAMLIQCLSPSPKSEDTCREVWLVLIVLALPFHLMHKAFLC